MRRIVSAASFVECALVTRPRWASSGGRRTGRSDYSGGKDLLPDEPLTLDPVVVNESADEKRRNAAIASAKEAERLLQERGNSAFYSDSQLKADETGSTNNKNVLRTGAKGGNLDATSPRDAGSSLRPKRRRDPWGHSQLRDAWTEDAMSRHEKDSLNKRLESEYRFDPFTGDRRWIKYMMYYAVPSWLVGLALAYFWMFDKPLWQSDPQHFLNLIRQYDTSPRSKFFINRPESVRRYGTFGPPEAPQWYTDAKIVIQARKDVARAAQEQKHQQQQQQHASH